MLETKTSLFELSEFERFVDKQYVSKHRHGGHAHGVLGRRLCTGVGVGYLRRGLSMGF